MVDGGFYLRETQGLKHKSRGGFGITFQLTWTAGSFRKTAGALQQKMPAEPVWADLIHWIMISRSRSNRYAVLIVRVRIGSNGSGGKGRGERRQATAGDKSRGGTARDSPEFTKIGALGVVSTRAWVRCGQRVTRDAPGPKTG